MSQKVTSISRALGWIVCVCTIPASIVSILAVIYHFNFARDDILASSIRRAGAISATVDTTIRSVEVGLSTLATSPYLAKDNLRQFQLQARSVLPILDSTNNVYLTDTTGQQLMNTLKPFGTVLPPSNSPELIHQVVTTGKAQVSNVFIGAVAKRPLVAIAVPVIRDDKVVMVLAATILPERLTGLLNRQPTPSDWIVSVHDKSGRFLARSHEFKRFVGQTASPDLLQSMQRQPHGTLTGLTREGVQVLAAHTRSTYTGWSVAVGIPKAALLQRLNLSLLAVFVIIVLSLGSGLVAASLIARRIKAAIIAMIPAAEALSRSDKVELPPDSYVETRLLGEALKSASARLISSEYSAQHDALTGLPNRTFLQMVLPRLQSQALRQQSPLTLLYLDLDGFKKVNDTLGHAAGDEVLFRTSERIRMCIRSADIAVRLGGDEFVIVLPCANRAGALETAERIRESLSQPIDTSCGKARVSVSIGIASFPDDCTSVDDLFSLADRAMYRAKNDGKNTVRIYSEETAVQ